MHFDWSVDVSPVTKLQFAACSVEATLFIGGSRAWGVRPIIFVPPGFPKTSFLVDPGFSPLGPCGPWISPCNICSWLDPDLLGVALGSPASGSTPATPFRSGSRIWGVGLTYSLEPPQFLYGGGSTLQPSLWVDPAFLEGVLGPTLQITWIHPCATLLRVHPGRPTPLDAPLDARACDFGVLPLAPVDSGPSSCSRNTTWTRRETCPTRGNCSVGSVSNTPNIVQPHVDLHYRPGTFVTPLQLEGAALRAR